ncbi:hypothetical protein D3C87_1962060 [compost metagenome]
MLHHISPLGQAGTLFFLIEQGFTVVFVLLTADQLGIKTQIASRNHHQLLTIKKPANGFKHIPTRIKLGIDIIERDQNGLATENLTRAFNKLVKNLG